MRHQCGRKKLNLSAPHRRSLIRNQAMVLIEHGSLTSTKVRVKAVQRFTERLVTLARQGNTFAVRRRILSELPYKKEVIDRLCEVIAPEYANRPGGYTRVVPLGRRMTDTAEIARLEWV
jgi:large subunit ribosomal protein L17